MCNFYGILSDTSSRHLPLTEEERLETIRTAVVYGYPMAAVVHPLQCWHGKRLYMSVRKNFLANSSPENQFQVASIAT